MVADMVRLHIREPKHQMEYFNNIMCITLEEWLNAGLKNKDYENDKARNYLQVVRKGGNGRKMLISFDSIAKIERKNAIISKYGDPREKTANKTLRDRIVIDEKATQFYSNFQLADERMLPDKNISQYSLNASILNAIRDIYNDSKSARRSLGRGDLKHFFERAVESIQNLKPEYDHSLPNNHRHLQRVFNVYVEDGYIALISGKFCNDNRRKVTADIEHLILSLYSMPNKPFAFNVWEMYTQFIQGKLDVVDNRTGELFNRNNFVKDGKPVELSEATVWNYLNNPKNRAVVDKMRSGSFQYNNEHRPHHHRHSPFFAFSKISMDDRDLPRKLTDGKRVKAYYAYDVASGCVIGAAYSRNKDEQLFIDCLRDTFRLIERNNFGMPAEVEVENHLVNKFFDDLALMFPYMRICNPGNSQEKRAEHFNRAKKYEVEKKYHKDIGRWWARGEAYRVDVDKVNDEFKERGYTYEQLVADDRESIRIYNNSAHPRRKYYPDLTRWDVLKNNMNPDLKPISKALISKSVGEHTESTIRRNQYLTVQYEKYALPSPEIINRLLPNNYNVDAYYLSDENGVIPEVYLYQKGKFICKCDKIVSYNESAAEQTADDKANYTEQCKYVSKFDKMTKDGKNDLSKIVVISVEDTATAIDKAAEPVVIKHTLVKEDDIEEMLRDYNPEEYTENAKNNL